MAASGTYLLAKLADMRRIAFGPRLNRIFQLNPETGRRTMGHDYELTTYEWLGESFIHTVSYALSFTYYCSPIVAYYVYQKGIFNSPDQFTYYMKVCVAICIGLAGAYLIRGYGRSLNAEYMQFYDILSRARNDINQRSSLQLYDFEFSAWPIDFRWNDSSIKSSVTIPQSDSSKTESQPSFITRLLGLPVDVLDYCLAYGLARPMAFPGSVKLLQRAMGPALQQGRTVLLEKNGLRSKLLAENGNEIDTMFIDRRSDRSDDIGNTLVICCEGNAAFYEVGSMGTPLKGGYSVLGWNHPGFLGSTGLPFPDAEKSAIDVVIRYAVTRLGFQVEDIIMFAWSIGGYTASYAAMMYPNIKALILDATFDSVVPLAVARMPTFAMGTVKRVINDYMLLDNTRHVLKYPGPIRLIRRQREEIIATTPNVPGTNRGNFLLIKLLLFRYPNIISEESLKVLWQYLCAEDGPAQEGIIQSIGGFDQATCESKLAIKQTTPEFPLEIGGDWSEEDKIKVTLYLATRYMDHFDATHCIGLPSSYFRIPWKHTVTS